MVGLGDLVDLCYWNNVNIEVVGVFEVISELIERFFYFVKRKGFIFKGRLKWDSGEIIIMFYKVNYGFNGYFYGIVVY